jgi:carboxyl-terminal processing protease
MGILVLINKEKVGFMLNILIALLIFSAHSAFSAPISSGPVSSSFATLEPESQHRKVAQLITKILTSRHYVKRDIDDSLSASTYDSYLEALDPSRLYFLDEDIRSFQKHRLLFDDYFREGYIQPAYDIFGVFQQRFAERLAFMYARLDLPFDFNNDEYMELDRSRAPWAKSSLELDELWRKRLENETLSLKLAGKEWPAIIETVRKRYQNQEKNISQLQSEDIFQLIQNIFCESFDPHTNYFSPKSSDNFRIQLSQSFEGIGARLSTDNDYTVVAEIIPGGPADKSGLLHVNDKITGVAQGKDGSIVDVIGWRLDDVVQQIRGEKLTVVRLEIARAGSSPGTPADTIELVREKIKLEDQSPRGELMEIEHEGKKYTFALIDIPTFYSDIDAYRGGDPNYKSTSRDVRKILEEFAPKNPDGVILDLRGNGGGYLNEAVDLTGLFIERGPVVQVRNSINRINVEWDNDQRITYRGPLAVVVDRLSASASEIFAAAIQDYRRGIIIGSQTFGKGTVQNPVDLNQFFPNLPQRVGQLKLTVSKFYRINGGSTQNLGVLPDISFPSRFNLMDIGENINKHALLWDKIEPLHYDTSQTLYRVIPQLKNRSALRLVKNQEYQELVETLDEFKKATEQKMISLQEEKRRKEREQNTESEDEQNSTASNTTDQKKIRKDVLLTESAHILGDYIQLASKNRDKLR